jgi:hypothetical protein
MVVSLLALLQQSTRQFVHVGDETSSMRVMTLFREITNKANVMNEVTGKLIIWKLVC